LYDGALIVGGPDGDVAGAVGRWYRREARRRVEAVAEREAKRLGLNFKSIAIRNPRTVRGGVAVDSKLMSALPPAGPLRPG
jgi:predicted metal-dependent hydrolase